MQNDILKENLEQNGARGLSGIDLILKERGSTYGDSGLNLKCMHDMLRTYEKGLNDATNERPVPIPCLPNREAHEMAIVMIIGKLARIATGKPHADNYDDIIGYATIAKEHAILPQD